MQRTAVINVVGLTESLLGTATPRLNAFLQSGKMARVVPAFPAVTCTAQSTYLTGLPPSKHGIVGNGWYDRELAEVQFWKQSNHLVKGQKIWDELREKSAIRSPQSAMPGPFTCAKLFWWYNMYSSADYSITPRPMYPADGRKFFDIYTAPYSIRDEIKKDLGEFPFPTFWGPAAGVKTPQGPSDAASRWIAESAEWIENKYQPTLSLVYLPHLDYNLQRHGPFVAADARRRTPTAPPANPPTHVGGYELNPAIVHDLRAIDSIVGGLIDFFHQRSVQVLLLSEYGITQVTTPIHLNRVFREKGWLTIKDELGLELLDFGASRAFAVADHQVAHIYLNDPSLGKSVRQVVENQPGVARVLGLAEKPAMGIDHPRSGDLLALSSENAWFTYYYWLDDERAPDFARCVDIHRKPGYDPVELFLDPKLSAPKLKIAWRLLQKKLGFRMLMDVIPLDAGLVKGSHGVCPADTRDYPLIITERPDLLPEPVMQPTEVYGVIQRQVLG